MKTIIFIMLCALILFNCSSQSDRLQVKNIAERACECFTSQNIGSVDERLKPCLSDPINENQYAIYDSFYSGKSTEDAIVKYMMDAMIYMVYNCDQFYHELDTMFVNMYPETSFKQVEEDINTLTDSIEGIAEMDSTKLGLVHQKIALLTKSRKLGEALNEIEFLSRNYSPSETYFIKMYIYRIQEKYDEALNEIGRAVKEGNEEYAFYAELIKRKKNDR